jgi:RNA polymerase sigma-70 factor (ECF subfamily)
MGRESPEEREDRFDKEVETLYQATGGHLAGYLVNLGGHRDIVEDVVQDSFIIVRRKWYQVGGYDRPEAYLYKVATNRMRRVQRDRYSREEPRAEPRRETEQDLSTDLDQCLRLRAAIRALPPRQREVVLLRRIYEFTPSETAEILQIKQGTVGHYLSEGIRRLNRLLEGAP